MQATYTKLKSGDTKLKSGDWGVRVEFSSTSSISTGTSVEVRKKNGEKKREKIAKVLWNDGRVFVCAIEASSASSHSEACAECGKSGATITCQDSSGMLQYGSARVQQAIELLKALPRSV